MPIVPLFLLAALLAALPSPAASAPSEPPEVRELFPDDGTPAHAFLVVDVANGNILRADDADSCYREAVPIGTGRRWLAAMAGMESGALDPAATVRCDSTCWARGAHGDVAMLNGLAWGCDTYARSLPGDDGDVAREASETGLDASGTTLRAWTRFWRRAERLELRVRGGTLSNLVGAATTAVASPRGTLRALHESRWNTRAISGETAGGAWVAGISTLPGGRRWAFALFVRSGSESLAASRCANLLEETRRTFRGSSRARGGEPWSEVD